MKILIADKFPDSRRSELESLGHEVSFDASLGADDLPKALAGHQVLVVRSTRVTADAIASAPELKLIIRAGAGTNTIDKAAAGKARMHVCNCPGKNSVAVAELAMGLMLAVDRRIPHCTAELRAGRWNKAEYSKADGIKGKTLGIVGMGAIGRELAQRARAFEMDVLGFDVVDFDVDGVKRVAELDPLLQEADVISLHLPLNDATRHLLNADRLNLLKDSAILINTSRGGVIDEAALVEAVQKRGLRVAVDVFENEPASASGAYEGTLGTLDTVVGTHHIGASTQQAQMAVAHEVVGIIQDYTRDGSFRNEVTA